MCVTRISLGLMINAGMVLNSSRRLIFGGPVIVSVSWEEFVRCQVRDNEKNQCLEAKRQFSDRNTDVPMNVQSPHKLWSTLKSSVFGSSSSLPLLLIEGGGLVCELVGKADLLSDHLTASSPGRLLICCSLAIRLLVLPPLPSGGERSGISS